MIEISSGWQHDKEALPTCKTLKKIFRLAVTFLNVVTAVDSRAVKSCKIK